MEKEVISAARSRIVEARHVRDHPLQGAVVGRHCTPYQFGGAQGCIGALMVVEAPTARIDMHDAPVAIDRLIV
jgi:hypothetical protein